MFLIGTPQLLVAQTPSSSKEKLNADLLDAAASGQTEKVLDLINMGVSVNAKGKSGYTALMLSAEHSHIVIVDLLKSAVAKDNS